MAKKDTFSTVKKFSYKWNDRGDEKQETQKFWFALLREIFEIQNPEDFIDFEVPVKIDGTTHFVDAIIKSTRVLIEQKSFGTDLNKPIKQSDGTFLTPYQQAKRYAKNLPVDLRPRFIIVCNFEEFQIYDEDNKYLYYYIEVLKTFLPGKNYPKPNVSAPKFKNIEDYADRPVIIKLEDFLIQDNYKRLAFLIDADSSKLLPEFQIAKAAVESLNILYNYFAVEYEKVFPQKNFTDAINSLAVRLLYCFYASDAHIFREHQLLNYLKSFEKNNSENLALENLFEILDCKVENRDKNISADLNNFPYINGGLFEKKFPIPIFSDNIGLFTKSGLTEGVLGQFKPFSWQTLNPTVFGSIFEEMLSRDDIFKKNFKRNFGMHYTSIENIHKVINCLFLDDLTAELDGIINDKHSKKITRIKNLKGLQNKISQLKFFDPACGSGNFLTETYKSLRKLENDLIREIKRLGGELDYNPVKVSINQFYGVEIFSYGVEIAKTALWIAEHQTLLSTQGIVGHDIDYLPLGKNENIHHANALTLDWKKILPDDLNFIIGNPPFIGTKYQSAEQKNDILKLCKDLKPLDYVTAWYFKAAKFMQNSNIKAAFVSTNSITQGEQVAPLWKILDNFVHIDFCHRTFKWLSESDNMAAVHCVVIGFSSAENKKPKIIFDGDKKIFANNINGYLQNAPNIYIEKRKFPLCENVPQMTKGSQPTDGGNLILSEDEKNYFIELYPESKKFIRRYMGADDLINNIFRYCFWFENFSLEEIKKFPEIYQRVEQVKISRLASKKIPTKKSAEIPHLFTEIRQPENDYLILPVVSSENRKYLPMDFVSKNIIANANAQMIPNANLFHFGILNSIVHNSWLRAICGRLEMRYAYSASIVYNNFIWCEMSEENIKKISLTGEKILTMRKKFSGWTLAKLYNERSMPEELRAVHFENDMAVLDAYGFDKKITEEEIVAELMKMYKNLTSLE